MATGPRLFNKDELKQYILRRLGAPVINIEITDEQLDDVIADTIEEFATIAYSGVTERYIPLQLDPELTEYVLPYDVFSVLDVFCGAYGGFGGGGGNTLGNPFSMGQYIASDVFKGRGIVNLLTYELTFEMIATLDLILGKRVQYDFNCVSKILHIHSTDLFTSGGGKLILHVHRKITPTTGIINNPNYNYMTDPISDMTCMGETTNIFDQKWVRKMSTEKARYQWATNLMKYQGSVLPNGGNLNGEGILNEAKENIKELNDELDSEYSLPADFFVG